MQELARPFGQQATEVWVPRPVAPLVQFAANVRALADTGLDQLGIPGLPAPRHTSNALAGFSRIYSWYGTANPAFRQACAQLPITFFPALPPAEGQEAAADFFLRQAGLPGTTRIGLPRLHLSPSAAPRRIVIHPFSGGRKKNWPVENYAALAHALRPQWDVHFVVGPEEEYPGAQRFANLMDLATLLAGSRWYIGNDSGITHLAAACQTPTVAIFLATNPAVWAPRGSHVRLLHRPCVADVLRVIQS